jgi:hypothetical protein
MILEKQKEAIIHQEGEPTESIGNVLRFRFSSDIDANVE